MMVSKSLLAGAEIQNASSSLGGATLPVCGEGPRYESPGIFKPPVTLLISSAIIFCAERIA